MLWLWTFVKVAAGVGNEDLCYDQYDDVYLPLYGACIAYPVLSACVEAEILPDSLAARAIAIERLLVKQPNACSEQDLANNCSGLVTRPELCETTAEKSSDQLSGGQIAAIALFPLMFFVAIIVAVRYFGSHRMPPVDPAKALSQANNMAQAITRQQHSKNKVHPTAAGLPLLLDDKEELSTFDNPRTEHHHEERQDEEVLMNESQGTNKESHNSNATRTVNNNDESDGTDDEDDSDTY